MQYDEFQIEIFLRTGEHEAALRAAFGDALYEDLAATAKAISTQSSTFETTRPKVFILPGIMGSRLSVAQDGQSDLVWVDPLDIAAGGIAKLKWPNAVIASGTVALPYLRLRLRLRLAGFDANFLPYDWRQSAAETGKTLLKRLTRDGHRDVTLVCHSMGGLVARQMAASDPDRDVIGGVVTIGTPNRGSYAPVQIFDLSHSMLSAVGLVDLVHSKKELTSKFLRKFPGLVEMLPTPSARPDEDYFTSSKWPAAAEAPTNTTLKAAKTAIGDLPPPDERFKQIIGYGQDTVVGAEVDGGRFVYQMSQDGDGTVPRDLAEMGDSVPRYYARGKHGGLCNESSVIAGVIDLLRTGTTARLETSPPVALFESLPQSVTRETLAEAEAASAPPASEEEFAGSFLTGRFDDDHAPQDAIIGTSALPVGQPAYPKTVIDAATKRWFRTDSDRQQIEQAPVGSPLLQAETERRIDAYTRRLISQVDAAAGNGQGQKISQELESLLDETLPPDPGNTHFDSARTAMLERVIGEAEEFLSVMFIKRAMAASAAVGRIVTTATGKGFGTGFLVAQGVLMTNHHVLPTHAAAQKASVQFRYELEIDSREMSGHSFQLLPDRLFHANADLDMAIVAVEPVSADHTELAEFGHLPLIGVEGKIRLGQPVNIIQHPLAGRKQVVFRESILTALPDDPDTVALYTGDTQPGSSGAPVFSDRWEVIALHHSGVPETDINGNYLTMDGTIWNPNADPDMRTVKWVANEGIRISRIVRHLKTLPALFAQTGQPGLEDIERLLAVSRRAAVDNFSFKAAERAVVNTQEREPSDSAAMTADGVSVTLPLKISLLLGGGSGRRGFG